MEMGLDSETSCSKNGLEPATVLDVLSKANWLAEKWDPFLGAHNNMLVFYCRREPSIDITSTLLC